ncbi:AMP-binding protein [Photorhabdus tasmaniensis]|uniref:AMP-binding protein n=1 Tax=Photorhabdus tasmaniensis TaxID=1004159 RepID=UPI0040428411
MHKLNRSGLANQCPLDFLQRIVRNVEIAPDKVAVKNGEICISYLELFQIAQRFKEKLIASGVQVGEAVGILQERTPEMIASLLAILALGAYFIPLDPKLPEMRLRRFVELGHPRTIMCDSSNLEWAHGLGEPILIDRRSCTVGDPILHLDYHPKNVLGYVLFTSGSTGNPKGVEVFRNSISILLDSMIDRLGLNSEDTVLAHSTIGFDMSIPELFLPLILGGKMLLASSEQSGNPHKLLVLLDGVTFMQATPTTWKILLALGLDQADKLTAVTGGESIDIPLVRKLLDAVKDLWNFYGPTEATVWACAQRLNSRMSYVPLGEPLANTHLLLKNMEESDLFELVISGSLVARGYCGEQSSKTNSFGIDAQGIRYYRTGDLVKEHDDDNLEWISRKDDIMKIRGNRVSLSEITSTLESMREVQNALVFQISQTERKSPILVAYIVFSVGVQKDLSQVDRYMKKELPSYMIPDHYCLLDEIPLLPSGKLDRKVLPGPTHITKSRIVTTKENRETRSSKPDVGTLEQILSIFRKLLGINDFSPDDDFFDYGGSSALAAVVAGMLGQISFSVEIKDIYDYRTARKLAIFLQRRDV